MGTKSNSRNMNDKNKEILHFENEDEERAFWATNDSTEYIDWDKAERYPVFPQLKRSILPASQELPD